jgi:glycosyltransferase involved in cell wall biosynthesis
VKRLKIGFEAKRIFHNSTGLGNYSRTLVTNLVDLYPEHEYHLFTPTVGDNAYAQPFLEDRRYHIHTSSVWPPSVWRTYIISRKITKLGLDIYHGLSHELPIGHIARPAQTVLTFHDLIYEIYPDHFKKVDQKLYASKYRRSAKLANHIISISESTAADLSRIYGIDRDKMTVCYQTCAEVYLNYPSAPYIGDYLLYVGSIIKRKGLLQIAQAMDLLPEHQRMIVKVVGSGSDYLAGVKAFIADHDLEPWFEFLGSLPNDALPDLYHQARALLLPSIYEGFGIPIVESLAVGTPVLTSHVSSLPEAAGPGALLVDPSNPLMISEAMRQLTTDTDLVSQLGQAGKRYVRDTFDRVKTTAAVMDVYQRLVSNASKA